MIAATTKEVNIVLWGNFSENDGDTVSLGAEDFGIALPNLVSSPRLVDSIYILNTRIESEDDGAWSHSSTNFRAFDWLMATFVDKWYFNKIFFDFFKAMARFHMMRMLFA